MSPYGSEYCVETIDPEMNYSATSYSATDGSFAKPLMICQYSVQIRGWLHKLILKFEKEVLQWWRGAHNCHLSFVLLQNLTKSFRNWY